MQHPSANTRPTQLSPSLCPYHHHNLLDLLHELLRVLCSFKSYKYWRIHPSKISQPVLHVVGSWVLPLNLLSLGLARHSLIRHNDSLSHLCQSCLHLSINQPRWVNLHGHTAARAWDGTWLSRVVATTLPRPVLPIVFIFLKNKN